MEKIVKAEWKRLYEINRDLPQIQQMRQTHVRGAPNPLNVSNTTDKKILLKRQQRERSFTVDQFQMVARKIYELIANRQIR